MRPLQDRLRARGWRMTAQRRAVADVLTGENLHLTADEVHERAAQALPDISRATVYDTLNELVAMGELAVVAPDGRANRYDPNGHQRHHHLHCTICGALADIAAAAVDEGVLADADDGFVVDRIDVVFRGRCAACTGAVRR